MYPYLPLTAGFYVNNTLISSFRSLLLVELELRMVTRTRWDNPSIHTTCATVSSHNLELSAEAHPPLDNCPRISRTSARRMGILYEEKKTRQCANVGIRNGLEFSQGKKGIDFGMSICRRSIRKWVLKERRLSSRSGLLKLNKGYRYPSRERGSFFEHVADCATWRWVNTMWMVFVTETAADLGNSCEYLTIAPPGSEIRHMTCHVLAARLRPYWQWIHGYTTRYR